MLDEGKFADLTGRRFGQLTVLRRAQPVIKRRNWVVRCDCGTIKTVRSDALRPGITVSCGCHKAASTKARFTRHGHARAGGHSREFTTWRGMRERCRHPGNPAYANYGGRGIRVCERWEVFENFLADMGPRPARHTLDRIDNDGNYEPSNCRWATYSEQLLNTRRSRRKNRSPSP